MTTPLDHIRRFHDELTAIRRDLHAHPELGFEEHRTSGVVAGLLASWGIEVHRDVGRTGVVGVIRNGAARRGIGLRCDMDALPIHETTNLPYASTNRGVMHACGHDGHTAMLLGAARYLAETKRFDGTVTLIFQPAEEGIGGAEAMLADGLFDRFPCDSVYGMHNAPGLDVGRFKIRPGAMMAGGIFFDLTVTGRGAHAAHPEGGIDPVLAAAHIVTALQSIVARGISPLDAAVVSCCAISGGDAYNVIPETVTIRGTARALNEPTLTRLTGRIATIARHVAEGFGATATLDLRSSFVPLVNDPEPTRCLADAAASLVGEDLVERDCAPMMGSEDFAYLLKAAPGAYIHLGNGVSAGLHNAAYDFNDDAIPYGAAAYASVVERTLST